MTFSEMKKQAQKIVSEEIRNLKKEGSPFVTSDAPLLSYDDEGRLENKLYSMHWSDGQSGETVSELTKAGLDKAIAELMEYVDGSKLPRENQKPIDMQTLGISLYGTLRGYESLRAYRDDEFEQDRGDFEIEIWNLREGIVCKSGE